MNPYNVPGDFLSMEERDVNNTISVFSWEQVDNKELNQCTSKVITDSKNCYEASKGDYHDKEGSKCYFFRGIRKKYLN